MSKVGIKPEVVRIQLHDRPAQISVVVPQSRLLREVLTRASTKLHFEQDAVTTVHYHYQHAPPEQLQLSEPATSSLILPERISLLLVHAEHRLDEVPVAAEPKSVSRAAVVHSKASARPKGTSRRTVEELRELSQLLMAECAARGIVVQLEGEQGKGSDEFTRGTERSNSRRGNTKSDKKRRRKGDHDILTKLTQHLSSLLLNANGTLGGSEPRSGSDTD